MKFHIDFTTHVIYISYILIAKADFCSRGIKNGYDFYFEELQSYLENQNNSKFQKNHK